MTTRRITGLIALIAAASLAAAIASFLYHLKQNRHPRRDVISPIAPGTEGYVGSAACKRCHGKFYDLWKRSSHAQAMRSPDDGALDELIADASRMPTDDGLWTLTRAGGRIVATLEKNGVLEKLPIVYYIGSENVITLITTFPGGRLQVLPFAYDLNKKVWFNYLAEEVPHTPVSETALVHDWRGYTMTWNYACMSCHATRTSKGYDIASDTYYTTWLAPGVECEACHGPSQAHITMMDRLGSTKPTRGKMAIIHPRLLGPKGLNESCAPCHARRRQIQSGFRSGDALFNYYDLPLLEDAAFWLDGSDRLENFTYTAFLQSRCWIEGGATCLTCHKSNFSPHKSAARYAPESNRPCVDCHQQIASDIEVHTHHPLRAEATVCTSCHMRAIVYRRMVRHDHTISVPVPAKTRLFGIPNACESCHKDKTLRWLEKAAIDWYGPYQERYLRLPRIILDARSGNGGNDDALIDFMLDTTKQAIYRASLARLASRFHTRNNHERLRWALRVMLNDTHPLVRSSALIGLADIAEEKDIPLLLQMSDDPVRLVQLEAVAALLRLPRESIAGKYKPRLTKALSLYRRAMNDLPDEPISHFNLGFLNAYEGKLAEAAKEYELALRFEPESVLFRTNLANALSAQGLQTQALHQLEQAVALEPSRAELRYNLALLLAQLGESQKALVHMQKAARLSPNTAEIFYNLGLLHDREGNSAQAIDSLERARALDPTSEKTLLALAIAYVHAGKFEAAIESARLVPRESALWHIALKVIAQSHEQLRDYTAALKAYQDARELSANPTETRLIDRKIADLKEHLGQP